MASPSVTRGASEMLETSMLAKGSKRTGAVIVGAALTLALAGHAFAYTGQEMEKGAKVSIVEARSIALKAHAGKIASEELEREQGGSGLRYSFDIKTGGVTQEVGVDAMTGRVLENAKEGKHPD